MKKDCIFCQIVAGESPAKMVYETEEFLVFTDIHPKAPVHVLIVPRKHIVSVNELEKDDLAMMGRAYQVAQEVVQKLGIRDGYQLHINVGEKAGQLVDHLHIHVWGGWKVKQAG